MMKEITIERKYDHYEVRACGNYVCTADTYAEAMAEANAYLSGEAER